MMLRRGILGLVLLLAIVIPSTLEAAPKDPPVESGGEGLFGRDWKDYGQVAGNLLKFRKDGVNLIATEWFIEISGQNPNFNVGCCVTSTGAKVTHMHVLWDYGDTWAERVMPDEGKAYWDWFYGGYYPLPQGGYNPTAVKNCVSFAFDGYKSGEETNARAICWVNLAPGAGDMYRDELTEVSPVSDDNNHCDVQEGDRCYSPGEHVWCIHTDGGTCTPAKKVIWKNNSSGIYTWEQNPGYEQNTCPGGPPYNNPYITFGIYRK